MAIAYRAAATAFADTTSVTITKPTGTIDNDIMLAMLQAYDSGGAPAKPAAPVGWTELCAHTNSNYYDAVFWKRATSEGDNYAFTSAGAESLHGQVVAYSGVSQGASPVYAYSNTEYVTSNTSLVAAAVTTTKDGDMLVFLGTIYDPIVPPTSATAPGSFTERVDAYNSNRLSYVAERLMSTAGDSGTATATTSTGADTGKHAVLVALHISAPPTTPTITAPTASAFYVTGETVDLTGDDSTDPNSEDVAYRWWYDIGAGEVLIGTSAAVTSGDPSTYEWDTSAAIGTDYTLVCRAVNEVGDLSGSDTVAVTITAVIISAPVDLSSHVWGTTLLTGKGYLTAAGALRLQWETDTNDPPDDESDDYDLITSAVVEQDTEVSVVGNVTHLGTWYVRARTLDTSDATSSWTSTLTIYVLEALRLDAGSQVELSIAGTVNKVYVLAAKSSPAVTGSATNTTIDPTYADSPRETLVLAPEGADSTACGAIATAQLAIRQSERVNISGLKVKLEDGMKLDRGDLVGVSIERMGIDGTYPVREMQFDVANDICEITVGEFWEPRTDEDALIAIAQKVQSLQKEAAQ